MPENIFTKFIDEVTQSVTGEAITTKGKEAIDSFLKIPGLKSNVEEKLRTKYGDYKFYNDFNKYIAKHDVIQKTIDMFYCGADALNDYVENHLVVFFEEFECSEYEKSFLKNAFTYIYEEIHKGIVNVSPHTEQGKVQMEIRRAESEIAHYMRETKAEIADLKAMLESSMGQPPVGSVGLMEPMKDDIGECSEKITVFLKRIDDVEKTDGLVLEKRETIEKYTQLLAAIPFELRGENVDSVDMVVCSLQCHIAIIYCNIGEAAKVFEELDKISPAAAEKSKLFHYVKAVAIYNFGLVDRYEEAKRCADKALELDSKYHRAFLVSNYLSALINEKPLDEILNGLEKHFEEILLDETDKCLIADYYVYKGFICRLFDKYEDALSCFITAKENGYDTMASEYNIGSLYYSMATQHIPKGERVFHDEVDVKLLSNVKQSFEEWILKDTNSTYIKIKMISIYISSCFLLGVQHKLNPIEKYIGNTELEYETIRLMILGSKGKISSELIDLLNEEDRLFAIISNCIAEDDTEELKRIIELIKSNEIIVKSEAMANMLLQACVANKDVENYWECRCLVENMIDIELLECLDAYIHEASGNIALAKSIVDKYADSSLDYGELSNILRFYARNSFDKEREQLLLRILDLIKDRKIYVEDKLSLCEQAINFLCKIKSEHAKSFIEILDSENLYSNEAWNIRTVYYNAINDVPNLLLCESELYINTGEYRYGYNKLICMIKLFDYESALKEAENLLKQVSETDLKKRDELYWILSDLCLFVGDMNESFKWAEKAHELFKENPHHLSHQKYLYRGIRSNNHKAFNDILEYKSIHPVVIGDWIKDIKIPQEGNIVETLEKEIERVTGISNSEYNNQEKSFEQIYKKTIFANSILFRRYQYDLNSIFAFAKRQKLLISDGNQFLRKAEEKLVKDDIIVDAISLIFLQRYGCLEALKKVPKVHICYSTVSILQAYFLSGTFYYVADILAWLEKRCDNIVFEANGYQSDVQVADIVLTDTLNCCNVANSLKIPFVTIEYDIGK